MHFVDKARVSKQLLAICESISQVNIAIGSDLAEMKIMETSRLFSELMDELTDVLELNK